MNVQHDAPSDRPGSEAGHRHGARKERVGLLGGGQLALMLAEAARRQGLEPVVLAASADDPAVRAGLPHTIGRLDDPAALDRLFAQADVVTIENEFLDVPVLEAALARHAAVRFHPRLSAIALVQDKLEQKRLFRRLGIPTADFEVVPGRLDADAVRALLRRFPTGFVLKWSRFGYDGRGNFVVSPSGADPLASIQRFCDRGRATGAEIYAEARIDFAHEVAMIAARAADGTQRTFPLVATHQERSVCREVLGPATALGLPARLEVEARAWMGLLAEELDFIGAFAVELFVDARGRMLVNEMAPRVHNSGHYSLWRGDASQFDLHVQAVTGRPLAQPSPRGPVVLMRNVLGPQDLVGRLRCERPALAPPPGSELLWYGKPVATRGRKMGHLVGRAATPEAGERLAARMAAWEERYWALARRTGETFDVGRRSAHRDRDGIGVGLARDEGRGRRAG